MKDNSTKEGLTENAAFCPIVPLSSRGKNIAGDKTVD